MNSRRFMSRTGTLLTDRAIAVSGSTAPSGCPYRSTKAPVRCPIPAAIQPDGLPVKGWKVAYAGSHPDSNRRRCCSYCRGFLGESVATRRVWHCWSGSCGHRISAE